MRTSAHIASAAVFGLILFPSLIAYAATLYLSPQSDSRTIGDTIAVQVLVSSPRQSINAVSGTVTYPPDKLRVSSISKGGSIIQFWAQEPSYSNAQGSITFEGVVPNPGFTGSNGNIITINFKAQAAGVTPLTFISGVVLANDGKGTNVLDNLGNSTLMLNPAPAVEAPPPALEPAPQPQSSSTDDHTSTSTPALIPSEQSTKEEAYAVPTQEAKQVVTFVTDAFSAAVASLALLYVLGYAGLYLYGRLRKYKSKVDAEYRLMDRNVRAAFKHLHDEIGDHVRRLEKASKIRQLSEEEDRFVRTFNRDLRDAEKLVSKIMHRLKDKR